jgi:hypothetical protein
MFVPVPCLALAQSSDQTKSRMTQSGDQAGQGASAGKGGNGSDANGAATPGGGASDANATAAPSSKPPVRRSDKTASVFMNTSESPGSSMRSQGEACESE